MLKSAQKTREKIVREEMVERQHICKNKKTNTDQTNKQADKVQRLADVLIAELM